MRIRVFSFVKCIAILIAAGISFVANIIVKEGIQSNLLITKTVCEPIGYDKIMPFSAKFACGDFIEDTTNGDFILQAIAGNSLTCEIYEKSISKERFAKCSTE